MWWPVYGRPQKESQTFLSRFSSSDVKMMAEGVFIMSKHGSAEANQESTKTIKQRANSLFNIAAGWPIVAVVLVLSFIVARCGTNESSSVDHQYSLANIQAQTLVLAQQEQSIDLTEWLKATVLADREIENFIVQRAPRVQKVLLNAASRTAAEFLPASTHTKFVVQPREVGVAELLLKTSASAPTKLLRVVIVPGEQRTFDPNGDAITLRGPSKAVQSAHVLYTLSSDEATSFSGSVGINWGGASYTAEGLGDSDCCKADSGSSAGCVIDDTVDVCAPLPFVGGDAGEGWAFINAARKQALYSRSGRVPLPHQLFVLASNKTSTESKNFMVEAKPTTGNSKKLSVDIYNYEYGDNDRLRRVGAVTAPTFFRVPSASQLQSVSVERHEGTSGNAQSPRGIKLSWDCPQAGRSISSGGSELGRLQHKVPYCNAMASVANGARAWLQGGDTFYMPVAGYKVERCECSDNTCSGGQCAAASNGWAVLARAVGSDIRSLSVPSATGGIYYHNNKLNYYNLYNAEGVSLSSASVNKALAANKFYRYRVLALNQALASSGPTLGGCDTSVSGNTREGGPCFDLNDAGVSGANRGSLMAGLGAPPATPSGGTPSGGGSGGNPGGGGSGGPSGPDAIRVSLKFDNAAGDATCDRATSSGTVREGAAVKMLVCLSQQLTAPLNVRVQTENAAAVARVSGSVSGGDYEAYDKVLTINPGSQIQRFAIKTFSNLAANEAKDFRVMVGIPADQPRPSSIRIADNSTYVTIVDQSTVLQRLSLEGPDGPVQEGGPAEFKIKLTNTEGQPVQASQKFYVRVRTIDGTATGATRRRININTRTTDTQAAGASAAAAGSASGGGSQTGVGAAAGAAASSSTTINSGFSVNSLVDNYGERCRFDEHSGGRCDFRHIGLQDISAQAQDECVVISRGQSEKSIYIQTYNDNYADAGESFQVEISEPQPLRNSEGELVSCAGNGGNSNWPQYLGLSSSRATARLQDKPEATLNNLLIGFFDADGYKKIYSFGEDESPTQNFVLRSKKKLSVDLSLEYEIISKTAKLGSDYEYTGSGRTITLARGQNPIGNIRVKILSDALTEGGSEEAVEEQFTVRITLQSLQRNCQKMLNERLLPRNFICEQYMTTGFRDEHFSTTATIRDSDGLTLSFVKNARGESFSQGQSIRLKEDGDDCAVDSPSDDQKCLFVKLAPPDNITGSPIEFRVLAMPVISGNEPKAGMGSDWQNETSALVEYTPQRCPDSICAIPVGANAGRGGLSIRADNTMERDEQMRVKIILAERTQARQNIRVDSSNGTKKLIIENDDFATVATQYAKSETCDEDVDDNKFKNFYGSTSFDIFEGSKLCIKMTCSKGASSRMTGPLKLNILTGNAGPSIDVSNSNGDGVDDGSSDTKLEWSANGCAGEARYASLSVPSYSDEANASNQFTLQTRVDSDAGISHLHWEQVQIQIDSDNYLRPSGEGHQKLVNIIPSTATEPRISFVYKGSSTHRNCGEGLSTVGGSGKTGLVNRPYFIEESSSDENFACFQAQVQPGGDSFSASSTLACNSLSLTFSGAQHATRWANPDHTPVIYFANPERSDIDDDFQPALPTPLPVASWSECDNSCCSSLPLAFAKVPSTPNRLDTQARGFKVDFSKVTASGYALSRDIKHFYIPKTLEDVPAPVGKNVELVFLGRSTNKLCAPLIGENNDPDLTRTLKSNEHACFEARLGGGARATENLALQLTTSSTDAPSEYVAATSTGENADYAAPMVFDSLGNGSIINTLQIASGQSSSDKISIKINSQAPGRGDKWFKVILAKPDGAGWPEGFAMGRKTEVGIAITHTDTTKPALAFKALAHVGAESSAEAIAKCRNAADYTQLNNDVPSGDRIGDADIKARVDEGRFVCAQSVYLTFDADVNSGANNCYKPGRRGGCWIRGSTPADNLTNVTLKNLSKAANKAEETSDYGAPIGGGLNGNGAGLVISNNKDISNIFVIEIKENKDVKVAGDEYEVLKSGLMHANMPANLQFLSSTAFNIEIPYSPEGADRDAPGYDGDEAPVPAIQVAETKLVKPTDSDAIVQFVFRGDNDLPSRQQQSQYIIQSCAIDDTGNGVPAQPAHDADCWRAAGTATGPGNGLVCSRVVASAAAEATNAGQLIKTSSVRPYTFTCTVAALAGKYHFFRVQDTGSSGVSDNSEFAYSRAVSVPAAPDKGDVFPPHGEGGGNDPSPIMARKVGSGNTLGIELSWKCPAAAHRKWACNSGAVPQNLQITANRPNADNDDIVDYQVWRCKMRNVNKGGTWVQPDEKRRKSADRTDPSKPFADTYTEQDSMDCEDFSGWLADRETRLPAGTDASDPNYRWPPNYDGYWAGIPAEKSYLIKMIWGDLRFGGAYADVMNVRDRVIQYAASYASGTSVPLRKPHTTFKTSNGKVIFTDMSGDVPFTRADENSHYIQGNPDPGIDHGRYKYRIRAVTKLGAPLDAYCDGVGTTMRDRLSGSTQPCASVPANLSFRQNPLGLVAKAQPKPTTVSVEHIEGDDTKLKLVWAGQTKLVPYSTSNAFNHVYSVQRCAKSNADDDCEDSDWIKVCGRQGRGNDYSDSHSGWTHKIDTSNGESFNTYSDPGKVFSERSLCFGGWLRGASESTRDTCKTAEDAAGAGSYKFGCIVSGLDKTKYHTFRVAEKETTGHSRIYARAGEGASSDWATTEPTLTTKPSLGVISAAKVTVGTGDAAKEGIQLSWACPPTSHRKWACGGSTTKNNLNMASASGQGAPDDDDIVDYHIYRCKMRDTNANGDYTDTTDDHTYNDSDDMSCQPLMNYDGYVVQESDTPGTPTEAQLATARASVNKLVWGDTRFGGAYADGTTTLTNAALKAADSERATCATFETVQDDAQDANTKRILFTDTCGLLSGGNLPNDGLAPGRYHYLVKAIKSGNLPAAEVASAQCGGVADTSADPAVASSLSTTTQECAASSGESHNHNGLSIGDSFSYNMGAVQVRQNANNKIQLSWSCPAEEQRDWDCAGGTGGTTVGTGSDAGYLLDSDNTDNAARNNPNKVGRYKIYRCEQGASGDDATRCSANTDWMSASAVPDYVKTSHKVSFSSDATPKMLFVDNDAAWGSGSDGAVAGKKYIYNVVVQNEFGTSATAATRKACQGPASLRNTVGGTAANCAETGTGISLHDRFAIYNLKVNTAAGKVVLSWDCPVAANREWACNSNSRSSQGAGARIQPPTSNRDSHTKVGAYKIDKCKIEDGDTDLGRCSSNTFSSNDISTRKVTVASGTPGRVVFTDHNAFVGTSRYGQSGSTHSRFTNPVTGEKWVYQISVYSDANTKLSGPITCSGPSGITSTPQACTSASTDTGVTIP